MSGAPTERLVLTTSDGHELEADLARVDAAGGIGAAVLCHPHPLYGGTRFDRVVSALFESLPGRGIAALRFDFRRAHGGGVAERLDVVAAIDALVDAVGTTVPLHLVGYSFGALVALGVDDRRVASRVLVAPPLTADVGEVADVAPPEGPVLLVVPEHDQFCPPPVVAPIVDRWRTAGADVTVESIAMADHFLAGRTAPVVELVGAWLARDPRVGDHRHVSDR